MVQENPRATTRSGEFLRRMRAYIPDWNLQTWLTSLAALATILGFALALFSGSLALFLNAPIPDARPSPVRPFPDARPSPVRPFPDASIPDDGRSHVPWGKDALVSEFVENTRRIVQDLMVSLEEEPGGLFDSSVLQSRQRLALLADQVETVARRWKDETYGDLDDAEYEFLRVLGVKLDELSKLSESSPVTPDVVDGALADVSKAVDDLSAVRAYPIVLDYTPLFVLADGGGIDDAVHVKVAGSSLTSGDPYLTIGNDGNNRCESLDRSSPAADDVLTFQCGGNLFPAGDAKGFQTGTLRVYREPDLLGSEPVEYSYSISIKVVPNVMGWATLSVAKQQQTERQFKSQGFSDRNAHCAGSYERSFQFNASDGWEIDMSSIDTTCIDVSSRSSCNGLRNITGHSFYYSCTIANAGTCGPFWRDGRGSCRGVVNWEEVRDVDQPDEELEAELRWDGEERIELPEGTRSVQGAIDGIDGIRRTFTDTGVSDSWFNVDVNLADRYVVIRPADLDAAMQRRTSGTE